ncbi:MAG: hypothetical protein OXG62_14420 [Nitrospinae bacterium]|nr:hypothetical protein [Nitrospinota bacterium]
MDIGANKEIGYRLAGSVMGLLSPRVRHRFAKSVGYKIPFMIGAKKASTLLMSELTIFLTALVYETVNMVYEFDDAEEILETYRGGMRKAFDIIVEVEGDAFGLKFAEKIPKYIEILSHENAIIELSSCLMRSLGIDPVSQENALERNMEANVWIGASRQVISDILLDHESP